MVTMRYNSVHIAFLSLLFLLVFSVPASALDPDNPAQEPEKSTTQPERHAPVRQPLELQAAYQLQTPPVPLAEKPSQFEQYIASKPVELTETQLDILRRLDGNVFQHAATDLLPGQISVAVNIVREESGREKRGVDAGYLIGAPDFISSMFNFLGLRSPFVVSNDIKQFGYDMFSLPPSTFAPSDIMPVGSDYLLGPGDELMISLWGKYSADFNPEIDRDGKINISQLGPLYVAGLTFDEARAYLAQEMSRYYKPSEVKMNISMGRLRTIRVFVLGKVRSPGSYNVSSMSTLINALYAAGGVAKEGSMRDIRVNRAGKTVAVFDLYDFLLAGDKSKDVRLMPEDVVFVSTVGPMAGISGNVKVPAIYELKGDTSVSRLIETAGGINGFAYNNRLQLLRVENGTKRSRVEMDLADLVKGSDEDFLLKDGDLVTIFPVPQGVDAAVHVAGAVKSSGTFGYRPGMRVSELLTYAGGLQRFANLENAELTRMTITPDGPKTERMTINIAKALSGDPESDVELKVDDYLSVKTVPEWRTYRTVSVKGEVRYPGTYTINKGETISSLIERAGGFTDKAYPKGATFSRESVRLDQQRVLDEMIETLEQQLYANSAIAVQTSTTAEEAGQKKESVEQVKALIAKLRAARAKGRIAIKMSELEKFKGGPYDIELEDLDRLTVPDRPSYVQVAGAVYNQTSFVYTPEGTVSAYLQKSGGMTKNADEDEVYVLKVDGTAVSKRNCGSGFQFDNETHSWSSGGFMSIKLDPGDAIVVPVQTEKTAWLRDVKDITQILFQIAVSAGVVLAL